jgi:hypothetical protein
MAVALPALFFAFVARLWPWDGLRSRLMAAAVVSGVMVVVVTEAASAAGSLTSGVLTAAWGGAAAAAGIAAIVTRRRPAPARSRRTAIDWSSPALLIMMATVAGITLVTGLVAARAWPSQWDSMVYHLPRIDHWLQNRTVDFYPTAIVRQLFNPPWSEFAMLNLIATGGDERCGNFAQWLAMLGSLVGVSLIASHLGAGLRGQVFAVLFCATIRMGILQASGTQNDYTTAFWLVVTVEGLLAPRPMSAARALTIGAAFGLAALCKGTAAVLGLPFLLVLWPWAMRPRWMVVRNGVLAALAAVALNAPHAARNWAAFGSPLGPPTPGSATGDARDNLVNQTMSMEVFASNVVRNLSLHMGTRSDPIDAALERGIIRAHAAFGLDVDDPRTTRLYPLPHFAIDASSADPDRTGNPVHLALVLIATGLLVGWAPRRAGAVGRHAAALALSFAAFCLVFKWQPWHARLQLPLFVLAAPLAAVVLERYERLTTIAAVLLTVTAGPPLLANYRAPLARRQNALNTPRLQQYFSRFGGDPDAREQGFVGAAEFLRARGCRDVGLVLDWDEWEHPLWVLLADGAPGGVRIRHVAVRNVSAALTGREPRFTPCAIFVGNVPVDEPFALDGAFYRLAWSDAGVKLLVTDGTSAAATVR